MFFWIYLIFAPILWFAVAQEVPQASSPSQTHSSFLYKVAHSLRIVLYEWLYCSPLIFLFLQLLILHLLLLLLTRKWTEIYYHHRLAPLLTLLLTVHLHRDREQTSRHIYAFTTSRQRHPCAQFKTPTLCLFLYVSRGLSLFGWPCSGHLFHCVLQLGRPLKHCLPFGRGNSHVKEQVKLRSNE